MKITAIGWSNKGGTGVRNCLCDTWKQHWLNYSGKTWPIGYSISQCSSVPTLGAHIRNPKVTGEKIVPMCDSCNKLTSTFDLKGGVTLVDANTSETCDK